MMMRMTQDYPTPRKITILDTAIASTNLGDQIIMDAVRRHLGALFPDDFAYSVASHDYMGAKGRGLVRGSDFAIASGTNLLSGRMWFRAPWKLGLRDALTVNNVILMGCGWYQYQRGADPYSSWLLRRVLSKDHLHAVRDSYSLKGLARMGITNVVNTSCPTLWDLSPEITGRLPKTLAREVVTTVNTYIKDVEADRKLLQVLAARYDRVHLWVQTHQDWDYAQGLLPGIVPLAPSLVAFDRLLEEHPSLDYVGNRLHGGIRALQKGRRAIIIEVDNRATEMGRDFGLPTVARTDFGRMDAMIAGPLAIAVNPPVEAIARWQGQFRK
jgi:polysaccharide pyruvyl transferase WcaK-like protein